MARLTAHLGHDNMAKVKRDDLETYFDTKFPGAAVGTLRDHIIQTKRCSPSPLNAKGSTATEHGRRKEERQRAVPR